MSAGLGAHYAGAGGAASAQPVPACLVLLLETLVPEQSAQAHQVCYETGARPGAGRSAHSSRRPRSQNLQVSLLSSPRMKYATGQMLLSVHADSPVFCHSNKYVDNPLQLPLVDVLALV